MRRHSTKQPIGPATPPSSAAPATAWLLVLFVLPFYVILSVAFLRFLQGETGTTFTGNWSWAPYLICTVAVVLVAAVAVLTVSRVPGPSSSAPEKESP